MNYADQELDIFNYPHSHLNRQLRAVLRIATSSPELLIKFCPYVSLEKQEIFWEEIFKEQFTAANIAAINWAYAIWTGETSSRSISIYDIEGQMSSVVLEALIIAMGLDNYVR